jgi:hypothetical protein
MRVFSVATMLLKKTSYSALFSILEAIFLARLIAMKTSSSVKAVPSVLPERFRMPNTSFPTRNGIASSWDASGMPVYGFGFPTSTTWCFFPPMTFSKNGPSTGKVACPMPTADRIVSRPPSMIPKDTSWAAISLAPISATRA